MTSKFQKHIFYSGCWYSNKMSNKEGSLYTFKGIENLDFPLLIAAVATWFLHVPLLVIMAICLVINFFEFKYLRLAWFRKKKIRLLAASAILLWNSVVILYGLFVIADTLIKSPESINSLFNIYY